MFLDGISPFVQALVACFTGVVSGLGIGGGTLLIIYLVFIAGADQRTAQGINLIYFLPTALGALFFHAKKSRVDFHVFLPAAAAGLAAAITASILAKQLDMTVLKRLFGVLLLYIGVKELFAKK